MKILVLNCGSSSLKFQLIDIENEEILAKGNFERIGGMKTTLKLNVRGEKSEILRIARDYDEAIAYVLKVLQKPEYNILSSLDEIGGVGHRIVHGGEMFNSSVLIDEDVISEIEKCIALAPLHNPASVAGIRAAQRALPGVPMVAVFDTAFHQTMPPKAYIYQIPYRYYTTYKIRKYGFHGTSHRFVAKRVAELMGKQVEDLKIINCHLGQGASICAIDGGKSIDTSMGLTPLGGIPMVTRSGDLDPSVVTYLMKKENLSADEIETILNKKSGLQAISGLVPDFREIELASYEKGSMAETAIKSFTYAIAGYIAKYAVAMKGIDYLVFTGGIGENQINIRKWICEQLEFMGILLDENENNIRGEEKLISKPESKVKIFVIPTNEELMIAKETERLVK